MLCAWIKPKKAHKTIQTALDRLDTQLHVVHLIRKLIYFNGIIKLVTTKKQRTQARKDHKFLIGVDRETTESSGSESDYTIGKSQTINQSQIKEVSDINGPNITNFTRAITQDQIFDCVDDLNVS